MDDKARETFRLYMNRMNKDSRHQRGAIFKQLYSKADSRLMRLSFVLVGLRVAEAQARNQRNGGTGAYCGLGAVTLADIESAIKIHAHTIRTLRRFYVGDKAVSDIDPYVAKILSLPLVQELAVGEKVAPSRVSNYVSIPTTEQCKVALKRLAEIKPDTFVVEGKSLKRIK